MNLYKKKGVQQESFDHSLLDANLSFVFIFLKCVLCGYVTDSQHKWLTWEPDESVISGLADESDRFPPGPGLGFDTLTAKRRAGFNSHVF